MDLKIDYISLYLIISIGSNPNRFIFFYNALDIYIRDLFTQKQI